MLSFTSYTKMGLRIATFAGFGKELLVQEEKSKSDLLAVFKELGYEIEL